MDLLNILVVTMLSSDCTEHNRYENYSEDKSGQDVVQLTVAEQGELLRARELECYQKMVADPKEQQGIYCPRLWDNVMCWGDTPAGLTVCQPCPSYINNFRTSQFASRTCLPTGEWSSKPDLNVTMPKGWTNFSACLTVPTQTVTASPAVDVPSVIVDHIKEMRIMYNIGYGLSLISLILAFIIMIYFRKLHCSRNTIHLNLFASFMLRASICLIRDNFMVGSIGFARDLELNATTGLMVFREGPHWECRLFSTVLNYTIASSYIWIFVEAMFLHMLIHVNVLSEKIRLIWYIVIGWTVPLFFVMIWAMMRVLFDNYLCWNTHRRLPGLIWILQAPNMVTIVINLVFFINLIRTLYIKISASKGLQDNQNRHRRMAKSVLLLIPVFGVYYIVFTIPLDKLNETVAFVMLFIEMFFNSYQGFFIAVVLCFINAEVRAEIRRAWKRRTLRSGSLASNMSRLNSQNFRRNTLDNNYCNGINHKVHVETAFHAQKNNNSKVNDIGEIITDMEGKEEFLPFIDTEEFNENNDRKVTVFTLETLNSTKLHDNG